MGKIKQDVPCQECGEPKAKWTYGHPEMMQKVFGLGPTENVRLCAKCQAKYERGTVADDGKIEAPVDDRTPIEVLGIIDCDVVPSSEALKVQAELF